MRKLFLILYKNILNMNSHAEKEFKTRFLVVYAAIKTIPLLQGF